MQVWNLSSGVEAARIKVVTIPKTAPLENLKSRFILSLK